MVAGCRDEKPDVTEEVLVVEGCLVGTGTLEEIPSPEPWPVCVSDLPDRLLAWTSTLAPPKPPPLSAFTLPALPETPSLCEGENDAAAEPGKGPPLTLFEGTNPPPLNLEECRAAELCLTLCAKPLTTSFLFAFERGDEEAVRERVVVVVDPWVLVAMLPVAGCVPCLFPVDDLALPTWGLEVCPRVPWDEEPEKDEEGVGVKEVEEESKEEEPNEGVEDDSKEEEPKEEEEPKDDEEEWVGDGVKDDEEPNVDEESKEDENPEAEEEEAALFFVSESLEREFKRFTVAVERTCEPGGMVGSGGCMDCES